MQVRFCAELVDELRDALKGLPIDQKARAEINELAETQRGNLDKVVQHGKRADAIVKNMHRVKKQERDRFYML
ncbi:MAG TPA: hypothetical protein VGJ76_10345 [Pseudolabrys sp.]